MALLKRWNMDPRKWKDPDEVGSSEYRAIHEHAMSVWNSNEGETIADRKEFVAASVREMREYLNEIIGERI